MTRNDLLAVVLALASAGLNVLALPSSALAGSVTYLGSDTQNATAWRTASATKTLQIDGSNVYGSQGYDVMGSSIGALLSVPTGLSITQMAPYQFNGNAGYLNIDNPSGGQITSGVRYFNPVTTGQIEDYVAITFTQAGSYTFGIFTDNANYEGISPSDLRIQQTTGGSADSGLIANTPTRTGEWYFFDVTGSAGDVFTVSGIAVSNPSGSDGIGVLSIDGYSTIGGSVIPEPGSLVLLVAGVAGLTLARRRRSA